MNFFDELLRHIIKFKDFHQKICLFQNVPCVRNVCGCAEVVRKAWLFNFLFLNLNNIIIGLIKVMK